MRRNVGSIDQAIRMIAGVLMLWAGIHWNTWLGMLGMIPLLTGLFSWCPVYALLDLTSKDEHLPHHPAH